MGHISHCVTQVLTLVAIKLKVRSTLCDSRFDSGSDKVRSTLCDIRFDSGSHRMET